MSNQNKRATIYFDPDIHLALRLKAAETDRSVSELVNEAVGLSFAEDADDLAAFADRVRLGLYRIVYSVHDTHLVVHVVRVGHREDVYRK